MAKQGRTRSLVALALGAGLVWAARDIPRQMGAKAAGERAERIRRSPQFADGKFRNTVPASEVAVASLPRLLAAAVTNRDRRHPHQPIPVLRPSLDAGGDGLYVTWFGHSSAMIEIDGR